MDCTSTWPDTATDYAFVHGWEIFPCQSVTARGNCTCGKADCGSPGKHPRTKNGLTDASADLFTIRLWSGQSPESNIAIATGKGSDIVVVDIDPKHGGAKTLADIEAEHGQLPKTVEVLTGGGGRHLYFQYPVGVSKVGSRNGWRQGIDIKADGGYVIAPPSRHVEGVYRWRPGYSATEVAMAEIPAWLLPLLPGQDNDQPADKQAARSTTTDGRSLLLQRAQQYAAGVSGANEGGRDDAAFNLAGHLAAFITDTGEKLGEADVLQVVRSWNLRCSPPLTDGELQKCVASAFKNGAPRAPKEVKTSSSPKSTAGKDGDREERKSQSTMLVELAADVDLFHDSAGEAYARFPVGDGDVLHWEISRIGAKPFRRWLKHRFYKEAGKAPSAQSLQDALGVIEAKAIYDGDVRKVFIRLAEHEERIYLDLANDRWQAIEIDRVGWRVVNDPPVMFRRAKAMLPLPIPAADGDISQLRPFANVTDQDWPLIVAWMVAAMRPVGPYPVLAIHGEHGSAKSTLARLLRSPIDPNTSPLRADYREPRDLMICANSGWVVALDNLSDIKPWLSDCFCRLATGGGFSTRTLYENEEETIFDAQRPLILNCIEEVVTRSDLLDRCVLVNLPRIDGDKRKPEAQLHREFEAARPGILGGLLTAVSVALRNQSSVKLSPLPRMADFAIWATAAEPALGLRAGEFIEAYTASRAAGNETAIEASPVGKVLIDFIQERGSWSGTATELLKELESVVSEQTRKMKSWPQTARSLGGHVKRLAANLRDAGVGVEFDRVGHKRTRTISLTRQPEQTGNSSSAPPATSASQKSPVSADYPADATTDAKTDADANVPSPSSARNGEFPEENSNADATGNADAKIPLCSISIPAVEFVDV